MPSTNRVKEPRRPSAAATVPVSSRRTASASNLNRASAPKTPLPDANWTSPLDPDASTTLIAVIGHLVSVFNQHFLNQTH